MLKGGDVLGVGSLRPPPRRKEECADSAFYQSTTGWHMAQLNGRLNTRALISVRERAPVSAMLPESFRKTVSAVNPTNKTHRTEAGGGQEAAMTQYYCHGHWTLPGYCLGQSHRPEAFFLLSVYPRSSACCNLASFCSEERPPACQDNVKQPAQ